MEYARFTECPGGARHQEERTPGINCGCMKRHRKLDSTEVEILVFIGSLATNSAPRIRPPAVFSTGTCLCCGCCGLLISDRCEFFLTMQVFASKCIIDVIIFRPFVPAMSLADG